MSCGTFAATISSLLGDHKHPVEVDPVEVDA